MTKIVPVLLAGGAGTRLWPVSRDALPKQFLPLVGERSSYQETLLRVRNPELFAPPIVITNADFRFFARRQAEELGIDATVAIEPMRRNSGPSVAAASVLAGRQARPPTRCWCCRANARRTSANWSPSSRCEADRGNGASPRPPAMGAIYNSIDRGERFQVKRIVVHPGGTLSLQKHHHRAEHWVVVRGTAEITIGDNVTSVHENKSIYIPIGAVHRLANRGKIPLELIEVQTGSYLGEDDIVRLDDVYKRD